MFVGAVFVGPRLEGLTTHPVGQYQGPGTSTFYRFPMGINVNATRKTLAALAIDPEDNALAALALTLAESLDDNPGNQLANQAREHRQCLLRLAREGPGNDELDDLLATLSTPVQS